MCFHSYCIYLWHLDQILKSFEIFRCLQFSSNFKFYANFTCNIEILMKIAKIEKFQTTLKFDLDIAHGRYRYENASKEFQEYVFNIFVCIQPFPADSGHKSHQQISKNYRKMSKNAIFQKLIFWNIMTRNMIFGRKSALWTPESTQKPHIDHST